MFGTIDIQRKLKSLVPRRLGKGYLGEAAVLLGIIRRDLGPHFLLTRRTEDVATHKGQISFPGGMREAGDCSAVATALRETHEEIGVEPGLIDIIGEFHEYAAITQQRVRCFAGVISPNAEYRSQSSEVAYVLEVPFDFFLQTQPRVEKQLREGRIQDIYFYDFNGETIWGLTARIIKDFVEFVHD
jgi:8-oxo-dGTP pyrophosphatase MutT (NUDIX family)